MLEQITVLGNITCSNNRSALVVYSSDKATSPTQSTTSAQKNFWSSLTIVISAEDNYNLGVNHTKIITLSKWVANCRSGEEIKQRLKYIERCIVSCSTEKQCLLSITDSLINIFLFFLICWHLEEYIILMSTPLDGPQDQHFLLQK